MSQNRPGIELDLQLRVPGLCDAHFALVKALGLAGENTGRRGVLMPLRGAIQ